MNGVVIWEPPKCTICDTKEDVVKCPIMTGIGFSAPHEKQIYVCKACIYAWYEGGGTTREELRQSRGL